MGIYCQGIYKANIYKYNMQRLTIKYYLEECPQWRDSQRKYNIYGNMGALTIERMIKSKMTGKVREVVVVL